MRNLSLTISLFLAIAACGPSGKEVAMAKQARYQGDKLVLFNATKAAVEANHKLHRADELALGMQTIGRWFTLEGMVAPGTDQDMAQVPDKSIRMTLVIRILPDGDNWIVHVEPSMLQRVAGSPKPLVLEPKDPAVPGWATGQVDTLQFEIHKALAQYEVKSPGGMAPPPTPAPAPAAPAPSGEGSAAPGPAPTP